MEAPPPTQLGWAGSPAGSGQRVFSGSLLLPALAAPCELEGSGNHSLWLGLSTSICSVLITFVPSLPSSTPKMLWSSTCSAPLSSAWEDQLFGGEGRVLATLTHSGCTQMPTQAWACAGSIVLSWMESSTSWSIQESSNRPRVAQTRAPTHEAYGGELTQKALKVNPDHNKTSENCDHLDTGLCSFGVRPCFLFAVSWYIMSLWNEVVDLHAVVSVAKESRHRKAGIGKNSET